jgi:hypothetical protein
MTNIGILMIEVVTSLLLMLTFKRWSRLISAGITVANRDLGRRRSNFQENHGNPRENHESKETKCSYEPQSIDKTC